eukprot:3267400-Rhodomonas_salina.1
MRMCRAWRRQRWRDEKGWEIGESERGAAKGKEGRGEESERERARAHLHSSIALVYVLAPINNSGARYHSVTSSRSTAIGLPSFSALRASPKSQIFAVRSS